MAAVLIGRVARTSGTFDPAECVRVTQHVGMNVSTRPSTFLLKVTIAHVVSYFVVGILAATVLDYEAIFAEPVISDYMRGFGSVALFVGPVVQVARGLITALVLLPFRSVLGGRYGWLWLWLLLVGIGILSTSAAAPSSIEGVIYTRLPLWYHLIGLPEILLQTLMFSVLVALIARHPRGVLAALPPVFERFVRAAVTASLAFVGYAVVSVLFAIGAGADVTAEQSLTLQVQGTFISPFIVNGVIAFVAAGGLSARRRAAAGLASYAFGFLTIFLYQAVILGATNPFYALLAPTLPALIVWLLIPKDAPTPDQSVTSDATTSRGAASGVGSHSVSL